MNVCVARVRNVYDSVRVAATRQVPRVSGIADMFLAHPMSGSPAAGV